MKKILFFLTLSPLAFSASGFTWLSGLSHSLHIKEHVLTFGFVGIVLLGMGLYYRMCLNSTKNTIIPDKGITFRNFVEAYGNFIYKQAKAVIGEEQAHKYFPFLATLFLFILMCNLIGLVPGFLPPTEYLSTTFALATFVFIYYNFKGCKELGTINYLKHFAGPLWYMAFLIFPIEILSNFIRPLSLALRLKGNMSGDHMVLSIFSGFVPYLLPVIFLLLGLLVSFIQAYVFTVLTMVYIALATAHHDHDEHEAHH